MFRPLRFDPSTQNMPLFHRVIHYGRYKKAIEIFKNGKVLDIGCGEGYGTYMLNAAGIITIGVDKEKMIISEAQRRYGEYYKLANCLKLPFKHDSFEGVACFELIEHLINTDQDKCFEEIFKVLKKGGWLILSTPNNDAFQTNNPHHVKELSFSEVIKLVERKGFRIIETGGYFPKYFKSFWDRLPTIFKENNITVQMLIFLGKFFPTSSYRYPFYVCVKE